MDYIQYEIRNTLVDFCFQVFLTYIKYCFSLKNYKYFEDLFIYRLHLIYYFKNKKIEKYNKGSVGM